MQPNQHTAIFNFRSNKERNAVKKLSKGHLVENRIATRARMLLLRDKGKTQLFIEEMLGITRKTVRLWEHRYVKEGIKGLYDKPGRGRKPSFSP